MSRHLVRASASAILIMTAQPALAAEAYVFDPAHSSIHFEWSHFGFSTSNAELEEFSGTLMLQEGDIPASEVTVTIDMSSVDSGFETFNGHLTDRVEWFNVERYPQAIFESTGMVQVGDGRYEVTGELTLKDVTREVVLDTTINRIAEHPVSKARTIGFDATTTVSRTAFDMGRYAPAIGDDVTIRISAEMQRKSDL